MKRILAALLFVIIAGALYIQFTPDFQHSPPTLYTNGNILTLNPQQPTVSAMFVEDGRIRALGGEDIINSIGEEPIDIVDLQGKTLMPGFIDPHTHAGLSLIFSSTIDLSGFTHASNEAIWAHFAQAVKKAEPGEVLVGMGLDPILTPDIQLPTKASLDAMAPNNPVVIFSQSLHNYWANSLAFEKAGVSAETPDPSAHSYYGRDSLGALNGLIVEQQAFLPFLPLVKENMAKGSITDRAKEVMAAYARNGNTTIATAGMSMEDPKTLMLWQHLSATELTFMGKLLSAIGQLPKRQPLPRHFIYLRHDMAGALPDTPGINDPAYGILGVKHWYDGSPYIGSMYMDEPYGTTPLTRDQLYIQPGTRGEALIEQDELKTFIRKYHKSGWQIAIHTQGNAAIREVLDAFEALSDELDFSQSRHRLEHCLMLDSLQIMRLKKLNITPSFHVNHITYYGDGLRTDLLGEQRAQALLPIASTGEAGIRYTLHADQPMFESKPFRLIQSAVERKTKSGEILGEGERITTLEAIRALTVDAAWQIGLEDQIGTLEAGKLADFIIADQNPLATADSLLQEIQVLETYVGGNRINF